MAGQQRVYKQRISSTQTLKKMFRAMELIAAARISKARERATTASPFAQAVTRAVSAVASHAQLDHPLVSERTDTPRVAVLVLTSDRGMAGAYAATVLRETERVLERLREEGKEPAVYVVGRRGKSYFSFRGREIVDSWEGESDNPSPELATAIARTMLDAFQAPADDG
ncbi:F0F1 ATP synthase subunit gamma, partial [Georgenia sp. 10Sc9-8]|nr:F0F1 ATP synthase subunit gamma [Georgenia halotolerans]